LINKAGFKISQAHTGAVTLIQRFGSALNLNLHFHVLFIDGVFSPKSNGDLRFHRVNEPSFLTQLLTENLQGQQTCDVN
jgi:hypothetical protein